MLADSNAQRTNEEIIDLDADSWAALKKEIEKSPRFREMYEAGGTFTDAVGSVRAWLRDAEVDHSPTTEPAQTRGL